MRPQKDYTISANEIHDHAAGILQEYLTLRDHGHKCGVSVLLSIRFFAASRRSAILDAYNRLRRAPTSQAVADALVAMLPDAAELGKRLNASLCAGLPRALKKRRQALAIDLTLIPYHGQPRGRYLESRGSSSVPPTALTWSPRHFRDGRPENRPFSSAPANGRTAPKLRLG